MPRSVFISHCHEDFQFAATLYDFLKSNHFDPWLDKRNLLPGQRWDIEINKALRNADFIILLLSTTAVQKRGYVQREFKLALDYCREKLDDDIYIIPIKIDECTIPSSLLQFQWVDYHSTDSFQQILSALKMQNEKYDDRVLKNEDNIEVKQKSGNTPQKSISSDFEIATTKQIGKFKPLVLPSQTFHEFLNYVDGIWQKEFRAPYFDSRPLNERRLPFREHIIFPYLTISDLLEPYIIRIPYPVNQDKYFNGNFDENKYGYILPLKKELFNYFSVSDIVGLMPDGKKFFELIKQPEECVEAVLRIPIKNGRYIEFSRMYFPDFNEDQVIKANVEENKGAIVEYHFSLAIYPFLKTSYESTDYRVMLIDCDTIDVRSKNNNYKLQFYTDSKNTERIDIQRTKRRSDKVNNIAATIFHVLNQEFDIVEVQPNSFTKGLIIPYFKVYQKGYRKYKFVIDVDTVNTNVEFSVDGDRPKPFEMNDTDSQLGSLIKLDTETKNLITRAQSRYGFGLFALFELILLEFIPEKIGSNQNYKFPIRTAIAENNVSDFHGLSYTLVDYNIPFGFGEQISPPIY